MEIRELAKSMISLSWAVPLLGAQQVSDLVTGLGSGKAPTAPSMPPMDVRGNVLDELTQSAAGQLSRPLLGAFSAGDELQREFVDEGFGLSENLLQPARSWNAMSGMMQMPAGMLGCVWPLDAAWLDVREYRNKVEVFLLVPGIPGQLGLPDKPPYPPLGGSVAKAYALEGYQALWAVEGLGHYYGDTFWNQGQTPQGILGRKEVQSLPAKSLTMLNAGVGLSIAQHFLQKVNHLSPLAEIRKVYGKIVELCKENATPGYEGAALESIGLVTRSGIFYSESRPCEMVRLAHSVLTEIDPQVLGYFWHGAGRAVYFLPVNFIPCYGSIQHGFEMVRQEAPDQYALHNALAGFSWGVTMVNIRHPAILAQQLKSQSRRLAENGGFSNGVASSLIMRLDTTPEAHFIQAFHDYQPSDPSVAQAWQDLVATPARKALHEHYPRIRKGNRLGEIFRHHPSLADLH